MLARRWSASSRTSRGGGSPITLREDGDFYLLKPHLLNQVHYLSYSMELHDKNGVVWSTPSAQPDVKGAFQIVIPHSFLHPGAYQLKIFGVDGEVPREVGAYDVAVPAE